MPHYDHAAALALGLDRWAKVKPLKTHESERMHRAQFEQARDAGRVSESRFWRKKWFAALRPGTWSRM